MSTAWKMERGQVRPVDTEGASTVRARGTPAETETEMALICRFVEGAGRVLGFDLRGHAPILK